LPNLPYNAPQVVVAGDEEFIKLIKKAVATHPY
jgi:hypothetical protein